jgi:hypothetical protein
VHTARREFIQRLFFEQKRFVRDAMRGFAAKSQRKLIFFSRRAPHTQRDMHFRSEKRPEALCVVYVFVQEENLSLSGGSAQFKNEHRSSEKNLSRELALSPTRRQTTHKSGKVGVESNASDVVAAALFLK